MSNETIIDTFPVLSTRTLMLIMGDYTHKIDQIEEVMHDDGEECFEHKIDRNIVEAELKRMYEYIHLHNIGVA